VVIVARDFLHEAVNTLIANHEKGTLKVLLVQDPTATESNIERLEDLAVYLGGSVVTEKSGNIVNKLTIEDFCFAKSVYADEIRTVITNSDKANPEITMLIDQLKKKLDEAGEDEVLEERIASLTGGMVTIKVGGRTPIEVNEKIYRYEDAVNAARSAVRDGYLVGGDVALLRAVEKVQKRDDLTLARKKFGEANARQIAENCGQHVESILEQVYEADTNFGYNAVTNKVEDLLKAGIIDPFKVTEMAVRNAVSVANVIISSRYLIVPEKHYEEEKGSGRPQEIQR
jgi:chaperonin GroEL